MNKPILFQYFQKKANSMLADYEVSSIQSASTNLGNNREAFVNIFLKGALPSKLTVTSGEVWDSQGHQTGQIDTLIVREDAPVLYLGDKNTYLVEGVFAAVEIKSDLTTTKLTEAAKTLQQVEQLQLMRRPLVASGMTRISPLRIVFAYKGATLVTLGQHILANKWVELFDLICILNRGALVKPGGLITATDRRTNEQVKDHPIPMQTSAAALGLFYYYLVQYGTSFSVGLLDLNDYFKPWDQWQK